MLTTIAFQPLAAVGGVIEIPVTVAGLAVFGEFVLDDFFGRADFLPATIAYVCLITGCGGGPGRFFAGRHGGLPDGGRAICPESQMSANICAAARGRDAHRRSAVGLF